MRFALMDVVAVAVRMVDPKIPHTKTGSRVHVSPGARIVMIVVMMLIAPRPDASMMSHTPKAKASAPGSACTDNGA